MFLQCAWSAHTLTHPGLPQMPGQVSTRPPVCCVLTAILQAEGLQVRCYHTGHTGDIPALNPGPFQVLIPETFPKHRHFCSLNQVGDVKSLITTTFGSFGSFGSSSLLLHLILSVLFLSTLFCVDRTGLLPCYKGLSVGLFVSLANRNIDVQTPLTQTSSLSFLNPLPPRWKWIKLKQ